MTKEKKIAITRIIITSFVLIALSIIAYKILPVILSLSTKQGQAVFKEKISMLGIKGPIYLFSIHILQMIIAIIPGEPIEMMASICYGFWGGLILCLTGFFVGSFIIFIIVRRVGQSFIELFFSKEKIEEIKNKNYFKNAKKFETVLFYIFLIPGIPKDIFIYLGGLSPVSIKRFLPLATFARLPALVISNYAGKKIGEGNIMFAVMLYLITLLFGTLVIFFTNRKEKNKAIK